MWNYNNTVKWDKYQSKLPSCKMIWIEIRKDSFNHITQMPHTQKISPHSASQNQTAALSLLSDLLMGWPAVM